MNKRILFIFLILSVFIIASCKSTPEPVEEEPAAEETVPEEVVEPAPEEGQVQTPVETVEEPESEPETEPQPEPVTREELLLARQALQRAEEMEASRFAPDLMKEAYGELQQAADMAESDPDASRQLLVGVIEKGDQAFEIGKAGLIEEARQTMQKLDKNLREIEADKFSPGEYQEVIRQFNQAWDLAEEDELVGAREAYHLGTVKAQNLYRQLSENIRWIKILERDTNTYLADAEEEEAYIWADKELLEASDLLSRGMTDFRQYDLAGSETKLKEAKFKARNAIYLANTRKQQNEADQLLTQIQSELEEASTLRVQTEEGEILDSNPWSGKEYLDENPLLEVEGEEYEGESSDLLQYNLTKPLEEEVEIVEEEEEEIHSQEDTGVATLLEQAKALWQEGVKARNAGDYARSKELFAQAEAYIKAYRNNAVGQTYTVQYNPQDRDCLWKIAGFDDIYGDPYLWPKIWKRNQKNIPNPDLIYPGQVLVIPPMGQ